jgi:hypothetical protein
LHRDSAASHRTPAPPLPFAPPGAPRLARYERPLLLAGGALFALILVAVHGSFTPAQQQLTQKDIDAAVLYTLDNVPMQSHAAKAYAAVQRSVVRVRGRTSDQREDGYQSEGVGSGVVIVDTGIILTNLHVVNGADQVQVEFFDGLESEATVVGVRPEHDLAVLQAKKLPDDLQAAHAPLDLRPAAGRRGHRGGIPVRHRPLRLVRRRLRAAPRIPLAAGQAAAHEPHSVRRRGQPG